ncbi:hypothetical protein OV079_49505 [Nannocystis pusilla]|uniref:Uncharacterized protein n=1 Tax=Nannocystis pusilla TaxID=889268 RepID=A0A9X3J250_9BACT|nr:hypothetical protein [Nannocystis pusilla]MCY1013437.1 hypothetical protein [Nannocystis pusilla]
MDERGEALLEGRKLRDEGPVVMDAVATAAVQGEAKAIGADHTLQAGDQAGQSALGPDKDRRVARHADIPAVGVVLEL